MLWGWSGNKMAAPQDQIGVLYLWFWPRSWGWLRCGADPNCYGGGAEATLSLKQIGCREDFVIIERNRNMEFFFLI
jgi:hypothetical protein